MDFPKLESVLSRRVPAKAMPEVTLLLPGVDSQTKKKRASPACLSPGTGKSLLILIRLCVAGEAKLCVRVRNMSPYCGAAAGEKSCSFSGQGLYEFFATLCMGANGFDTFSRSFC